MRDSRLILSIVAWVGAALLAGCAAGPSGPTTRPATEIDPRKARAEHWLAQPATEVVEAADFEALWAGAEHAAKGHGFDIDRRDRRLGVLTTEPLVSRQFFEVWRNDVVGVADLAHSSLNTVRRTVYLEFERREDGVFSVSPKVLVEQASAAGRRITSAVQYRGAFGVPDYWYVLGRDERMERVLAGEIRKRVDGGLASSLE